MITRASPFLVSSVTSSRMHSATSVALRQKRYNMHFKIILNPVVEGETPQNVDVVGVTTNKDLR